MTHCRKCGVLEEVGDAVICEDCADHQENPLGIPDYFSGYDIACAALVLGIGVFVTMAVVMGFIWVMR
jgi:hypothetical protein